MNIDLKKSEQVAIAEILDRRANDIADFKHEATRQYERIGSEVTHKTNVRVSAELPGSVELALTREIDRLRRLADKVRPAAEPEPDEDDS